MSRAAWRSRHCRRHSELSASPRSCGFSRDCVFIGRAICRTGLGLLEFDARSLPVAASVGIDIFLWSSHPATRVGDLAGQSDERRSGTAIVVAPRQVQPCLAQRQIRDLDGKAVTVTISRQTSLRLCVIRHGESEWSLSGQYTGRTDIPLTAHGEAEVRQLGLRIRDIPFVQVLTSPLKRAQQTCALAGLNLTPDVVPDFAEWDNGDDEGRTREEVLASRPGWNLFRDRSPNGETPARISDRADRVIACVRLLEGNVALFCHSHFGRVFAAKWLGLSVDHGQQLLFDTASLSVLCIEHDRTDQPAIALWNFDAMERSGL